MSDVQIAIIDQENIEVNLAVPGIQGAKGDTGTVAVALDGTAAAPGISFASDTNTGIYRPGADQLAISTGGTGRLFVDASGRVGVGTSNVTNALFQVSSPVAGASIKSEDTGGTGSFLRILGDATSGNLINWKTGTVARFATSDDNFGTFTERARIRADGMFEVKGNGVAGSSPAFSVNGSAPANSALIDSNGRLGVGTTGPTQLLHVSGTGGTPALFERTGSNGCYIGLKDASGSLTYLGTSNGVFAIQTPGSGYSDKLVVTSAGNVGIGTTSPAVLLDCSGTGSQEIRLSTLTSGDTRFGMSVVGATYNWIDSERSTSAMKFGVTNTERMRIDTSGRLLVGTSSARSVGGSIVSPQLQIESPNSSIAGLSIITNRGDAIGPSIYLGKSRGPANGGITSVTNDDTLGDIKFAGADNTDIETLGARISCEVDGTPGANDMPGRLVFSTTADGASSPTERMRIRQDGKLLIGTTALVNGTEKLSIDTTSAENGAGIRVTAPSGYTGIAIERSASDGELITFVQAGTTEGNISVSGTTVSYNGAHLSRWSQLPGGAAREEILRGTVLSNIDEMCGWGDEDNEQLNRMQVSDVEGDPNVSGVFQSWDDTDDTYADDFYCAMTGDFIIRISAGIPVHRGQLLMSAGDGTAKPQDDDIVRSKTIAKVTSNYVTCTYDDGSYCVPCVLMAC